MSMLSAFPWNTIASPFGGYTMAGIPGAPNGLPGMIPGAPDMAGVPAGTGGIPGLNAPGGIPGAPDGSPATIPGTEGMPGGQPAQGAQTDDQQQQQQGAGGGYNQPYRPRSNTPRPRPLQAMNPFGWGGAVQTTPGSSWQNSWQLGAINQQARALADLWGQQAMANAQVQSAGITSGNQLAGVDLTSQRQLEGTRNTNETNRAIQDMLSGRQLQGIDLTTGRQLEGTRDTNQATRDVASTQAGAARDVAGTNALANMYGADRSLDIAGVNITPEMAAIQQRDALMDRLFGTGAGGLNLGSALQGALDGALGAAGGRTAGGTGTGEAGGGIGAGGVAAPRPVMPRFNPIDEQRANSKTQSMIERRTAGQKNRLADMYGAGNADTDGADYRREVAAIDRDATSQLMDALRGNREQALEFDRDAVLANAQLQAALGRNDIDWYNATTNAAADRAVEQQRNALMALNPLFGFFGNILS